MRCSIVAGLNCTLILPFTQVAELFMHIFVLPFWYIYFCARKQHQCLSYLVVPCSCGGLRHHISCDWKKDDKMFQAWASLQTKYFNCKKLQNSIISLFTLQSLFLLFIFLLLFHYFSAEIILCSTSLNNVLVKKRVSLKFCVRHWQVVDSFVQEQNLEDADFPHFTFCGKPDAKMLEFYASWLRYMTRWTYFSTGMPVFFITVQMWPWFFSRPPCISVTTRILTCWFATASCLVSSKTSSHIDWVYQIIQARMLNFVMLIAVH